MSSYDESYVFNINLSPNPLSIVTSGHTILGKLKPHFGVGVAQGAQLKRDSEARPRENSPNVCTRLLLSSKHTLLGNFGYKAV